MMFFCSCASSGDRLRQSDRAQVEHSSVFRPVDGRVVDDVSVVCELNKYAEFDRAFGDSFLELIEEGNSRFLLAAVESSRKFVAGFGHDPVAAIAGGAAFVGECIAVMPK